MWKSALYLVISMAFLTAACGGDGTTEGDTDTTEGDDPAEVGGDVLPDPGEEVADVEDDEGPPLPVGTCADPPPPGAEMPAALPIYSGDCPALSPGRNTIASSGTDREFILVVPGDLSETETLPLLFLWHYLGGDAAEFLEKGEVQTGVNDARFLAAIPEEKGDLMLKWPYMSWDTDGRIEEEARLFDDILACVAARFNVNTSCVSSVGVSSGALWTAQLAQRRPRLLASMVSLSGGVGQSGDLVNPVKGWGGAEHVMPAVVLWGGPSDFCGITFASTSGHLEEALESGGHFFVECIHNCSHAEPPMEPPPGESKYASIWTFVLDHPYWLGPGASPYETSGLPEVFPAWCGLGRGSATMRSGECEGGALGDCM